MQIHKCKFTGYNFASATRPNSFKIQWDNEISTGNIYINVLFIDFCTSKFTANNFYAIRKGSKDPAYLIYKDIGWIRAHTVFSTFRALSTARYWHSTHPFIQLIPLEKWLCMRLTLQNEEIQNSWLTFCICIVSSDDYSSEPITILPTWNYHTKLHQPWTNCLIEGTYFSFTTFQETKLSLSGFKHHEILRSQFAMKSWGVLSLNLQKYSR